MPYKRTRARIITAWFVVAAAGVVAWIWGWHEAMGARWERINGDTRRCALAFQADELAGLAGARADENTPLYAQTKKRLIKLNKSNPKVERMYLMRHDPKTGHFICLAADEPGGPGGTRPGDIVPNLLNPGEIDRMLRGDTVVYNDRYEDASGRWFSAFARIPDDPSGDIIRLDAPLNLTRGMMFETAFARSLYVILLLGLPLAVYSFARRYALQSLVIQKLIAAMEQSATPMMIINADNIIEYVNSGLCALSKYTREELVGKLWIGKARALPSEKVARVEMLSHEGKTWTEDLELERKDGGRFPANVTSTPVRNAAGQIVAFIVVITDMTEIQRQASEMRMAKEHAENADKAKGVFLATMSHEVRTPLNGIVGFSDLLLDTDLTPEQREYVHAIHSSGEALMQLTGDILDHSRIESGRMQLMPEPCDARSIIEDALDIAAPRAAGKKLQLLHSVDPAVPLQVMADPVRLRQVIVNLVGNAIKFTPAGEVEVSLRLAPPEASPSRPPFVITAGAAAPPPAQDNSMKLEFTVRDTGIGIAAEDQSRLFRPFVQLDSSNARRYGGAGLGLVISYDLVRLMGGSISISSELGQGAMFVFTVRCGRIQTLDTLEDSGDRSRRLAGKRIAVVSGYPALRREIERELAAHGATASGVELEKLDTAPWDLAVLDCDDTTLPYLRQYMQVPERWHAGKVVGLVEIDLDAQARNVLRPYFRALVGKPLHHRLLVERLARSPDDIAASSDSAEL